MTGLVYLAIIVLWAVFLIPWLSRHRDEQNGRRSADRYHRAMDSLARATHGRRRRDDDEAADLHDEIDEIDDEIDETDADELDRGRTLPPMPSPTQAVQVVLALVRRPRQGRGGTAARRRRRVLIALSLGLAGTLAGALAGVLPGAAPALFVGLLVAYLTVLLRAASRAGLVAPEGSTAAADRYREATRRAQDQARGLLAPRTGAERDSARGWDAVPTTLPTYVSKPKATKVPRIMDLTAPGRQWDGQAMVQRAQQERRRTRLVQAQEQFDREMAVMEPDPMAQIAELANPAEVAREQRPTYRRAANG